jgi:hypothetical protein
MKKIMFVMLILVTVMICWARENIVSAAVHENQIEVTFVIPEGMHQTLQEDYFFVEVDSVAGVTFEPTVYPQGHPDADGYINYEGTVVLTKAFTIAPDVDPADITITLWAGYQFCFPSYCEPPEEVEISLTLAETPQAEATEK